ncbi:MAG: response regulator transcription factor [Candidatus Omnitrophica bacterium]|nr:response regulator transcription factor [Candidatus Omnitrophota bacterium]
MAQKILIVEDDRDIARLVQYNFEKSGFSCVVFYDGAEALAYLQKRKADLLVLDIMMPGMDGLEVCRTIRADEKLKKIPVVMLTAKGEEVDRIVGLELGADDYLVKPFSPRELVLRVKAILRRGKSAEDEREILSIGVLSVDLSGHTVSVDGRTVDLSPKEFELLVLLMRRRGRVQTRENLLADVWDIHTEISTRTVDTHIKRLREKLGKPGKLIETVVGVGYRFRSEDDED